MEQTKLVYILSQRYSGSTLLSFLLGTHPSISTIGERRKFYNNSFLFSDKKYCSCEKLFQDCSHWSSVKENLLERVNINEYSTNPTEFKLFRNRYVHRLAFEAVKFGMLYKVPLAVWPFKKRITQLCEFNRILVEEILQKDGGEVFLDSSKIIDHALFLSRIPQFDVHIIWLTRDPRAQVHSALKYNDWSVEKATNYWKKEMVNNKQILKRINAKSMELTYEALCSNPQKEMVRLLDFLALDSSAFSLDFRKETQHIMGNYSMRLGKDTSITERKDWQTGLSGQQINTIEAMTASYQEYYTKES